MILELMVYLDVISLRIQWDYVRCLYGFDGEFYMDSSKDSIVI